jgi:hypothetical protein
VPLSTSSFFLQLLSVSDFERELRDRLSNAIQFRYDLCLLLQKVVELLVASRNRSRIVTHFLVEPLFFGFQAMGILLQTDFVHGSHYSRSPRGA